jgi:serine/threonine-protein kinase
MAGAQTDRNLLFGVLALQADFLDAARFAEACSAWSGRKDAALSDLLVERGWITPRDREDIERLLERKLQKHAGDVRASLVEAATGPDLRHALAAIADPDVQHTLSELPAGDGAAVPTVPYQPQSRARYTLAGLHAQGGIGQVWLAQDGDLGRSVALKELRPEHTGSDEATVRFLDEARITGQLEHPGIVPVYELARRDDGQPFYVMCLVRGRTLREAGRAYHQKRAAGRAGPLDLRELLGAFVAVCNAVGYAHSRGVIHRDLKGPNVVLGDFGEVIVLDWGLAKVVARAEGPAVSLGPDRPDGATMQGRILGTPGYLSPEQAVGRLDLIDERSDVYGLGAILYEILTGRPPFIGKDTSEVIRQAAHADPLPPRDLVPGVPRALEAVCLRALAREREGRYPSAVALADDVRRYLADEPVVAYREPAAARLARWGRRHKPLVAGAAALLLAAVVALSVGTVLLGRANARIEGERAEAQRQRDRADANFRKARQAVDDSLTRVSENKLLNSPGLQPLRKELLEAALPYYRGFAAEAQDDPALSAELARAYYRLGKITEAVGTQEDAIAAYRKSHDLWEQLVGDHADEDAYQSELADCCLAWGQTDVRKPGDESEQLKLLERALGLYQALSARHPGVAEYRRGLAESYGALAGWCWFNGRPKDELPYREKALDLWEQLARDDPQWRGKLGSSLMNIGYYNTRAGNGDQALKLLGRARDTFAELSREQPNDLEYRQELRRAYTNIGFLHSNVTGRSDLSLEAHQQARAIAEALAHDNPAVVLYKFQQAGSYRLIARVLANQGEYVEAEDYIRRGLEVVEAGRAADPRNVATLFDVAEFHQLHGRILSATGRPREGIEALRLACKIMDEGVAANPGSFDFAHARGIYYRRLGTAQARAGDEEARQSLGRAVEYLEAIDPAHRATNAGLLGSLVESNAALGDAQRDGGRRDEADRSYQKVVALWENDLHGQTSNDMLARALVEGFLGYAALKVQVGDSAGATRLSRQAEEMTRRLPNLGEDDLYQLARARALAGSLTEDSGERSKLIDQAMSDLSHCCEQGGPKTEGRAKTADELRRDPALKALRDRPDFQKLLTEREAKEKAIQEERQRFEGARRFLADGDHARAVEEVGPALASPFATPATLVNGARVLARASASARQDAKLTAAERERLARQYADRAIELLRQAVAKGYKGPESVARLKTIADFDPLRERDDFKALLGELEKTSPGH